MKMRLAAIAMIAMTAATPAYASKAMFDGLSGKWRGKGLVKASEKGKQENIRCRMTNKPEGADKLDLSGTCAVGGFAFSLSGFIQQNGGKNSYTASMFRSLANLKQSNFSGKRNGKTLNLSFKAYDKISKTDITASIRVALKSANAFDVSVTRTDPESGKRFNVGTIKFTKK